MDDGSPDLVGGGREPGSLHPSAHWTVFVRCCPPSIFVILFHFSFLIGFIFFLSLPPLYLRALVVVEDSAEDSKRKLRRGHHPSRLFILEVTSM